MLDKKLIKWIAILASFWLPIAIAAPISLDEKLAAFQSAFGDRVSGISGNIIKFKDGTETIIDDGRRKSHEQKLENADLEDMFSQIYPVGSCFKGIPSHNFDPGRIRNDGVMKALFGRTKSEVESNTVQVHWFGQRIKFSHINNANEALARVIDGLQEIIERTPDLLRFLKPSGGTLVWRNIAGTKRLSAHSFGVAIDISTKYTDYWRWAGGKPGNVPTYHNKIPLVIVEIFERHGFIWGGKWYHFDTMHFEYRPDLIAIARLAEKRGCTD